MSTANVTCHRESSAWRNCLKEIRIEGARLLAQSRYDPFRRTYLSGGNVYKIALLTKEVTSQARAHDLSGEHQILKRCTGIMGVPKPVGYQRTDTYELLVLEELPGDPLSQLAVTWPKLIQILAKLARLIFTISWRGVSHNDIKPENILVSPRSSVSLIDFDQATHATFIVALIQSLFGVRVGQEQVRGSLAFIILKRLLKDRLPPKGIRFLRRVIRDKDVELEHTLPTLPENASPQARAIYMAWKLAQTADASSPSRKVAYYSLEFSEIRFPGERPWEERWQTLRAITNYSGKRVIELGCNMALLSCFLLKEAGARAALAVDADKQILEAARIVSSAFDVAPTLRQINFDDDHEWEKELLRFQGDIVFALNVLNWVRSKKRLLNFLGRFPELIFEGHDSLDTEISRLRSVGFEHIDVATTTERGRHVLRCRQKR